MYDKFPTPLINRLEKHFVLTSSILEQWQEIVLTDFEKWIKKFAFAGYKNFTTSVLDIPLIMYAVVGKYLAARVQTACI